jgi:hypothetical protein
MALEFHIITSHQFLRLGSHGELDWPQSLGVLTTLVEGFAERSTDLAMVDLRDTNVELNEKQLEALAVVLKQIGVTAEHRIAILFSPAAEGRRPPIFVDAARKRGFDIARFYNYEEAAEWLSTAAPSADDEFDRDTYEGPGEKAKDDEKPGDGPPGGENGDG